MIAAKENLQGQANEIARLLDSYERLNASVRCNPEQMAITVMVPPPWTDIAEMAALRAQNEI